MTLAGIKCRVDGKGRVAPVAREWWRLVHQGKRICKNDEYLSFAVETWTQTVRSGERVLLVNESHYRRRMKESSHDEE